MRNGLLVLALACITACGSRRATRTVSEGSECTSPYDDTGAKLVCAYPDECLLMQSTPPGPSGKRPYLCVRSCKKDEDCAPLGAYRCEHEDGHGDDHGCTPR